MIQPMNQDLEPETRLYLRAMGLSPLQASKNPALLTLRALLLPSFHEACCLTLVHDPPDTLLEWTVLSPGGHAAVMAQLGYRGFALPQPPAQLAAHEIAEPSAAALAGLWSTIEAVDPLALESGSSYGIDGMPVRCESQRGARVHRFHCWSPRAHDEPLHHRYLAALLQVAQRSLSEPLCLRTLADVNGYLR